MRIFESVRDAIAFAFCLCLASTVSAGVIIDKSAPHPPRSTTKALTPAAASNQAESTQSAPTLPLRKNEVPQATVQAVAPQKSAAKSVEVSKASQEQKHTQLNLTQAVKLIVPQDWKGYARDKRIGTVSNLAWKPKGQPWPAELEAVLDKTGIAATLNWTKKEVEFRIINAAAFKEFTGRSKRS